MENIKEFSVIPNTYQLTGKLGSGEVTVGILDGVCFIRVTGYMENKEGKIVRGQLFTQLNQDQYEKFDDYMGSGSGIPLEDFMLELKHTIGLNRDLTELNGSLNLSLDHHQIEH